MTTTSRKFQTMDTLQTILTRPFSVIIFDIDGVLTEHAGTVSEEMIEKITSILNKRIYVNLVSGRPRYVNQYYRTKGGRDINEVFRQIRQSHTLTDSDNLKYLFGFEQNGSAVFDGFADNDSRKKPLDLQFPTMDPALQKELWHYLSTTAGSMFSHAENKSHSMALWVNNEHATLHNLPRVKAQVDLGLSHFKMDKQLKSFQTQGTIDIGPAGISKATAVDFYIKAGFTLQQIARIGDSTYTGGNDQPMVMYNHTGDDGGFSVEHYSELDQFPVTSLPQIIGKTGVAATHWLLDHIRFQENQPYVF